MSPVPAFDDSVRAFCAHGRIERQTRTDGPLAGLTFGVKDLFDVAGVPTGAGSPAWLETHPVPMRTAPAVERLLDAGARLVGKTHTDEIAWSLAGQNAHYGTPTNPAAPDRIPGGSSSGSAAATAAGLVDFALGSDTGGSVRLPASFCGLYGMRPTHGNIPIDGAVALAPSYDSVGWFARDPGILLRAGQVLLNKGQGGEGGPVDAAQRLLVADDLFDLAGLDVRAALAPAIALMEGHLGPAEPVQLAGADNAAWRETFRILQSAEAWAVHGAWIAATSPRFGPGIKERFEAASQLPPAAIATARDRRAAIRAELHALVQPGTVLLLPAAPGPAPRLDTTPAGMETFRRDAIALLCAAGHAGLPQISVPAGRIDGCPIGLGVIGWPGGDLALLRLAQRLGAVPHG